MTATPLETAVTSPVGVTVATAESELDHNTVALPGRPLRAGGVSWTFLPAETVIAVVSAATLRSAEPTTRVSPPGAVVFRSEQALVERSVMSARVAASAMVTERMNPFLGQLRSAAR